MDLRTGLPEVFPAVAIAVGAAGGFVTAWLAPRKWSATLLALWSGFSLLAGAGALAAGSAPNDGSRAFLALLGSLVALGTAGALCVLDLRTAHRRVRLAEDDAESVRRELDRLAGMNVRLEDEARDLRHRARATGVEETAAHRDTIDRQRRALDAVHREARLLRALLDAAPIGCAVLERETLHVTDASPALCRLTGRDAKTLARTSVVDLFVRDADAPGRADLQRCARDGSEVPVRIALDGGGEVRAGVRVVPVGADDEARLVAYFRDAEGDSAVADDHRGEVQELTARLEAAERSQAELEERLRASDAAQNRLLDRAERKDRYVSSVAHELRTPLTSIRSFSEILLRHDDVEPALRREFAEIIHKESDRLARIVTNVLDLARIESGHVRMNPVRFDAREVVADAVDSVRGLFLERGVRVEVCGVAAPLPLRADRDRVQQLLVNLLGNALKFSPDGGTVVVTAGRGAQSGVTLAVADQGSGISPEDQKRLFERFQRLDDDGQVLGTGLGLSICREIVRLHGGRIWVESAPGRGSVFHADLPSLPEEAPEDVREKTGEFMTLLRGTF